MSKTITSILLVSAALSACSEDSLEEAKPEDLAIQVSDSTLAAADVATLAAYTAQPSISGTKASLGCVTIQADSSFVEYAFDHCQIFSIEVDGTLRFTREVEGDTVILGASAEALVIGATQTSGTWQLSADQSGSAAAFQGELDFDGGDYTAVTSVSAALDLSARCSTVSSQGDLSGPAGSGSFIATDVLRCGQACPASGSVMVDAATGVQYDWSYNGTDSIVVTMTTPAGVSVPFGITLPCE
jgi:hypothetical protein